jgi:hypothetical protein
MSSKIVVCSSTPSPNNDIRHVAAGNLAFLLSVIRCGEKLSEDEEQNVRRVIAELQRAEQTVCQKHFHMYIWSVKHDFVAIAQAASVAEARELLISDQLDAIGESGDGSCQKRDEAREFVRTRNPEVFHYANAHFALTDSAELEEQEAETRRQSTRAEQQAEENARLNSALREIQDWANGLGDPEIRLEKIREAVTEYYLAVVLKERKPGA